MGTVPARPGLRRPAAVLAAVVVLAVAGAGSCDPEEKPTVDAGRRAPTAPTGPVLRASFDRHSELAVAEGLRPQVMEFATAYTGYVLFTGCSQVCGGALFVTFDGGQSWLERTLPFERAESVNFWLVDARTIIVSARPAGWFRSTDGGRTFVRGGAGDEPGPAEYARGPSVGCVERKQECPRVLLLDGVPAPAQPPLGGELRGVTRGPGGRLYAAAAAGAVVTTATSADGGHTWTPLGGPVTVQAPGPAADPASLSMSVSLSVSPDGKDVWLLANTAESLAVYLWEPAGWREVKRGIAVNARQLGEVAVGQRVLAVASTRFSYLYADGEFRNADRPSNALSVRLLGDGTLMTSTAPSDVWLGTGEAAARIWSRITVDPQW